MAAGLGSELDLGTGGQDRSPFSEIMERFDRSKVTIGIVDASLRVTNSLTGDIVCIAEQLSEKDMWNARWRVSLALQYWPERLFPVERDRVIREGMEQIATGVHVNWNTDYGMDLPIDDPARNVLREAVNENVLLVGDEAPLVRLDEKNEVPGHWGKDGMWIGEWTPGQVNPETGFYTLDILGGYGRDIPLDARVLTVEGWQSIRHEFEESSSEICELMDVKLGIKTVRRWMVDYLMLPEDCSLEDLQKAKLRFEYLEPFLLHLPLGEDETGSERFELAEATKSHLGWRVAREKYVSGWRRYVPAPFRRIWDEKYMYHPAVVGFVDLSNGVNVEDRILDAPSYYEYLRTRSSYSEGDQSKWDNYFGIDKMERKPWNIYDPDSGVYLGRFERYEIRENGIGTLFVSRVNAELVGQGPIRRLQTFPVEEDHTFALSTMARICSGMISKGEYILEIRPHLRDRDVAGLDKLYKLKRGDLAWAYVGRES